MQFVHSIAYLHYSLIEFVQTVYNTYSPIVAVQISRVYYPGLPSHPDHEVAKRLMKRFSGMVSFELKGGKEDGIRMVEVTRATQ